MLVGRERERADIEHALERARSGDSATLALVGEPGIGKTGAARPRRRARARGMQLLRARGVESEAQIPFASLLELLRPALGDARPHPAAAGGRARERARAAAGPGPGALCGRRGDAQPARHLRRAGPVAVLVDDAHWLDRPSAEALLFAVRRLVADPIAVLVAVREGEPSLLDGADLPDASRIRRTEPRLRPRRCWTGSRRMPPPGCTTRPPATRSGCWSLHATHDELALAPEGAPLLVSAQDLPRIPPSDRRARRGRAAGAAAAATSDSGDLALLERAASTLGIELSALSRRRADRARRRGRRGRVPPSAGALGDLRRCAAGGAPRDAPGARVRAARPRHRPPRLAPGRGRRGRRRAGSPALEQARQSARDRARTRPLRFASNAPGGWRPTASAAPGWCSLPRRQSWHAGSVPRAVALLERGPRIHRRALDLLDIDELAGHIATRQGPVMRGHAILTAAAEHADPERAIAMLAEATGACFYAGDPVEMLVVAERAASLLPKDASVRTRFLASIAHRDCPRRRRGRRRRRGGDPGGGRACQCARPSCATTCD